jgi:hypothetical protein
VVVALLAVVIIWKRNSQGGDVPTPAPPPNIAANSIDPGQPSMSPPIDQQTATTSQQPVPSSAPSQNTATTTAPANGISTAVKNSPPSIRLTARSIRIVQGEDVEIIANAHDADGDPLSYSWDASSGDLVGGGDRKTLKTASANPGQIEVRSVVADGRGLSATGSIVINVLPRPISPPSIARVEADRTRVTSGEAVKLRIYPNEPATGLNYRWSSSSGSIRSEGQTATLDTSGVTASHITVIATIVDSQGRTASASTYLSVDTTTAIRRREETQPPGPVSASASIVGDDLVVSLTGRPGNNGAPSGTIEVMVGIGGANHVIGHLPVGDCRWGFLPGPNVKPSSMAFKETAGPYNRFSRIVVRLRPNNNRQPVRFTLTWRQV